MIPLAARNGQRIEDLYNRITGDEGARVCKDIPEAACNDQPHNFFAYLGANLLGKVADEIASAKLVIPWLFGALGVPAALTGFLVPIREAGVLLPQLAVAAAVRRLAIRKGVWILAALLFATIREQSGATEGGGNAISVAIKQLRLIVDDAPFRRFVFVRALLLSIALAPPFYVLLAQQRSESGLLGLGALIVANGLATSVSAPFWGYVGDRSCRAVMAIAAFGAGLLGLFTFAAVTFEWDLATSELGMAGIFLVLNVMHGGVRLGRKIYLVDMASGEIRAAYVAVSNTLIGVLMLAGGLIGLIGDWLGAAATVLVLGLLSLIAAAYSLKLPDVSEPS